MASSRTGSARHKRVRREVLAWAQDSGLTHCPCALACKHHRGRRCGVVLDYVVSRQPNSAEPDHIKPWVAGGDDSVENMSRVVCRQCNQARGNKPLEPVEVVVPVRATSTTTVVSW
jgi:hypothetical protein